MEQTNRTTVIRILLFLSLGIIGFVIIHFLTSPVLMNLRHQKPITFIVLTTPPAIVKYYPKYDKVQVLVASDKIKFAGSNKEKITQVENMFLKNKLKVDTAVKFFVPNGSTSSTDFWGNAKNYILNNRKKPYLLYKYSKSYYSSRKEQRCSLNFLEFIALTLRIGRLTPSDFLIALNQKGRDDYLLSDLYKLRQPVLIRIFNAGKIKGLARKVTDYIRFLNSKGEIKADVISYGNWKNKQNTSSITTGSEKFLELSHIAKKLGLYSSEIIFERKKSSFADAFLILSDDIKLPKSYDGKSKEMIN
jgi:hypothetical protein